MESVDIGIVIVNYNTRDLLRRCLETVLASKGVSYRVCVVDNDSGDGSAAMVAAEFPEVLLIHNADNVGYPAANNQGLRLFGYDYHALSAAAPRYALLLNADTELPEDGLAAVVAFADSHADVGVIGPKLIRLDGTLDKACRRSFPTPEVAFYHMAGLSKLFPKSPRFGRYNLSYLDENETAEVDSVVGAFMMVRGEAIGDAGLLDDCFFMYAEDLDWAYRLKKAGWRVVYFPGVTVLHVKRASSSQNPRARVEFWRSMEIFYRKHYAVDTPGPLHALIVAVIRLQTQLMRWRIQLVS